MDYMSFSMLTRPATATPDAAIPGTIRFFSGGYIAMYSQAAVAATLDGGVKIDAYEGCWRGISAAGFTPPGNYIATNDLGDAIGGLYVCAGFPLVDVPGSCYAWFVLRGYVPTVPAVDTTYGIGVPIKLVDNAGSGTQVNVCTTDEQMIGIATSVDTGTTVNTFIAIPYWI